MKLSTVILVILFLFITCLHPDNLQAQEAAERAAAEELPLSHKISNILDENLEVVNQHLSKILFYEIRIPFINDQPEQPGIPFLVFWLIIGGVFFTVRMGFVNIRMFGHAINVVRGKFSNHCDPGEISHFSALTAAVSATVGLGNIAGVAVAVSVGGPGAVIWMAIAGLFGMSTKFAEVTMGQKYREIDENGKVTGGAFFYLKKGLAEKGLPGLGKILAVIFAFCCMLGAIGGGNMFQSNQSVKMLAITFSGLESHKEIVALIVSLCVGIVVIGGITRIAKVASKVVPFMAILYITCCITVIAFNIDNLGNAFSTMFRSALGLDAAAGGIIGAMMTAMITGVRRATFSNEAGVGSAPIAHATAKCATPVRQGCVALLEPFLDTVVICFLTGVTLTITNAYMDSSIDGEMKGVMLTSKAFSTVSGWFPNLLAVAVLLFAYSTMITWCYYGERAWGYLFGFHTTTIFKIIFCIFTYIGGVATLNNVVDFSDLLLLSMSVPNLIGLYILSSDLKKDLEKYQDDLKNGNFRYNK